MRSLSTQEVCEATGATYRQLDYWSRLGVFDSLGLAQRMGSGRHRRWPIELMPAIWVLTQAMGAGLSTDQAKQLATVLEVRSQARWVVITGTRVTTVDHELDLAGALADHGGVGVVVRIPRVWDGAAGVLREADQVGMFAGAR